jgi:hypothetical protein
MNKTVMWVLLGVGGSIFLLVAGIVGLIVLLFSLTRPVAEGGDRFLALLGEGKTQQAYLSTATSLQAQQSEASFTAEVRRMGLTDYASVRWHSRSIVNDEGRLEGTVTTRKGRRISVTITLVKEGGTWKVLSVTAPRAGTSSGPV